MTSLKIRQNSDDQTNYNQFLGIPYQSIRIQNCWSRVDEIEKHNEDVRAHNKKDQ